MSITSSLDLQEIDTLERLLNKLKIGLKVEQERVPVQQKIEIPNEPEPSSSADSEEDDDSLLQLDDLPKDVDESKNPDSLVDVGEELVEDDDEPVEEVIRPKLTKNSSLNEEIVEEGEGRGNRQCVRVAFSTAPKKNRFKDNAAFAKEDTLKFDKKVRTKDSIEAHSFIQKRKPVQKVVVTCKGCSRRFRVDAQLAPQRLDSQDSTSYQCDNCILQRKG